jgi:hypothetical protein
MAKKISASDIFAEEDIFLGIRNSAEKTILTFQEIDAEVKKLGANIKKDLSGADFGNTKGINNFVAATQKANDAKNKSIQIDKVLVQASKDVAAADKALIEIEIKKQKLVQEEIRTAQQKAKIEQANANAAKKSAEASKVQMDSYKQLAASTRDLKNQSKELGAQLLASEKAGKSGTAAYAQLEQQFKEVTIAAQAGDAELKQIDKTVGDNFRNVGNYEGATKGLKQQLREMTVALQNMESTDPRFKQMTIDAGELKDKIMDTNAVIKSTAGSAVENLGTGIAKAGKVGIDAFAGMTGAMGLFGIESEGAMQAMLKLQQLAAMSEALQSLGALGDTVTEVKAAFIAAATKMGIFTSAKVTDTTVTTAQTVATEGATVATSGLGKAMKALPIIAIIAGIAALAYGIYSLVSGNEEAEKATKKRAEAEKRAAAETKAHSEFISKESSQYVGLIYQLKSTNQNSAERSKLIKQINSQYGTTLKNISNEIAFQAQLNLAIQDYIKYQEKRYLMEKNDKFIQLNLQKQDELRQSIRKRNKELAKDRQFQIEVAMSMGKSLTEAEKEADSWLNLTDKELIKLNSEMAEAQKRMQGYSGSQVILTSQTEGKYTPVIEGATAATKVLAQANEDLKKSLDELWIVEDERSMSAEDIIKSKKRAKDAELKMQHSLSTDLVNRDQQLKDALMLNQIQFEEDMKALKESKDVTIAGTAVDETQYKLNKAKGLEAVAFEFQLLKNKHDLLNEEEEKAILDAGNNAEEKLKIRAEYNLKHQALDQEFKDKSLKTETDITDKEKEELEKRLKTQEEFIKMTTDFFIKNSEKKIAQMDKEIAKAENQYSILQTLAANGNINAQESLAEQQRIINEANARKDKEMKRQQRIKLAESVYSTYNSKVAGGSEHPLMDTIKDTILLQQFIASLPTFFDGTEDTGKNGNGIDGKGGFHAVLHPNERVIPKSLNEQIGGLSNEALAKMASEYQNGKIIRSNSQIGSAFDTAILVGKLDELTSAIKQKPETNIGIGEITQSVMEIVKSTKQGNTTTYNRYKVRR